MLGLRHMNKEKQLIQKQEEHVPLPELNLVEWPELGFVNIHMIIRNTGWLSNYTRPTRSKS